MPLQKRKAPHIAKELLNIVIVRENARNTYSNFYEQSFELEVQVQICSNKLHLRSVDLDLEYNQMYYCQACKLLLYPCCLDGKKLRRMFSSIAVAGAKVEIKSAGSIG